MQTGKSAVHPVVLLEEPGSTYWSHWFHFVETELLGRNLVSKEDMYLVKHARSIEEAVEELTRFYHNYQSQRWVNGRLVLRIRRLPPVADIEKLEDAFADILGPSGIQVTQPSNVEVRDKDELDCERLAVGFNQSSVGRLRKLIDELNAY